MTPTEPGWERAAGRGRAGLAGTGLLDAEPTETLGSGPLGTEPLEPGRVDTGPDSPPAPSRQDREEQQRHLRLVQNQARRRAGRRRLLVVLGIATVAFVGLALVGLHVLIAENQFRLDRFATTSRRPSKPAMRSSACRWPSWRLLPGSSRRPRAGSAWSSLRRLRTCRLRRRPRPPLRRPRQPRPRAGKPVATSGRNASSAERSGDSAPAVTDPPTTGAVAAPQGDSDWPSVKPYLSGSP